MPNSNRHTEGEESISLLEGATLKLGVHTLSSRGYTRASYTVFLAAEATRRHGGRHLSPNGLHRSIRIHGLNLRDHNKTGESTSQA